MSIERELGGSSKFFELCLYVPVAPEGQVVLHVAGTAGVTLRTDAQVLTWQEDR